MRHACTATLAACTLAAGLTAGPTSASADVHPAALGDHTAIVAGDFTGDGVDDVFFHAPGSPTDVLYDFTTEVIGGERSRFVTERTFSVSGSYRPVAGDFTGDGVDDILWYRPGSGSDVIWDFAASGTVGYQARAVSINGTYAPVVGDFTGDGAHDVFFYAPGSAGDFIWEMDPSAGLTYRSVPQSVGGTAYAPVAGHFWSEEGEAEDIYWYNRAGAESMWDYPSDGSLQPRKSSQADLQVTGSSYLLAVSDLRGDDYDDLIFIGPGSLADSIFGFYGIVTGAHTTAPTPEPIGHRAPLVVGLDSWGEAPEDFFVYDPATSSGTLYDSYVFENRRVWDEVTYQPAP